MKIYQAYKIKIIKKGPFRGEGELRPIRDIGAFSVGAPKRDIGALLDNKNITLEI
jgi:hypothetical protein